MSRGWETVNVDVLSQYIAKTTPFLKKETKKCLEEAVFRGDWLKKFDRFVFSWNKYLLLNETHRYVVVGDYLKTAINIAMVLHQHEKWKYEERMVDVYKCWVDEVIDNAKEVLIAFNEFYKKKNDYNFNDNASKVIDVFVVSLPLYVVYEIEVVNGKTIDLDLTKWGNIILLLCRLKNDEYLNILKSYLSWDLWPMNQNMCCIELELEQFLSTCDLSIKKEIQNVLKPL